MLEARLVELETRIAFQEDSIQGLSDVIYRQQKQIDQLENLCRLMAEKLQDDTITEPGKPADEKPPHY